MATREEIYNAIRNADKAGDSAAVRKLGEFLKTMPAEEAATPAAPVDPASVPGSPQNAALHQQRLAGAQDQLADATSFGTRAKNAISNYGQANLDASKGLADTAATLGASTVMTPLAGVAGLATGATNAIGLTNTPASEVVEKVAGASYQPKSDVGKEAMGNVAKPFTWLAGKADKAGQVVSDVTGSPALGTLTNTAIQAVPVFLSKGARAPFVSGARAAAGAAGRAVGGVAAADAAAAESAAVEAQSVSAATAKAEKYAGSVGLDWNGLADSVKAKLTDIAKASGDLSELDPEALKRYATLQGRKVPVPATRGKITRDTTQLLNEDLSKSTPEGRPIQAVDNAADNALQANLDALKGRVSGTGKTAATATNAEEAGGTTQGAARGKEAFSKANYDKLFKVARETEPDARASVTPVTDLLTQNPEIQHLGWVQTWLNRAAKLAGGKEGEPVAITDATPTELADLRSQASEIARTGGKEGLYAGKVVGAIDQAMESVPESAKAWRAANQAYKAHKMEFSEQGAVADLVENSSRTDRSVRLESTAKTITNGSLEDIRKVKRTLLTGGDEATRTAGRKAWREIRAQVMDNIKEVATKSAQEKADGTPRLSVAKLKQVIDSYGPDKLEEIFGPGTAKEVYRILDAAQIVKYAPESLGSNSVNKVLAFLGKGLDKIPGGGKVVDVARGIGKLGEIGSAGRTAEQANLVPLDEALKRAKGMSTNKIGGAVKTTALSSFASGANKQ